MSFSNLLTDTLTLKTLTATTGIKKVYNGSTAYPAMIQPSDDTPSETYGMSYGKMFKVFLDVTCPIKIGDKVTDQNANSYSVHGIKKRGYGNYPHVEAMVQLESV